LKKKKKLSADRCSHWKKKEKRNVSLAGRKGEKGKKEIAAPLGKKKKKLAVRDWGKRDVVPQFQPPGGKKGERKVFKFSLS